MSIRRSAIGLAAFILAAFSAGAIGSIFTASAIPTWYAALRKPPWTPPGWVFGPVWTTLYLMMGVAAWLVWRRGGCAANRTPLILFALQLAANALWSILFFGLHAPGAAFLEILILWSLILATALTFRRVSSLAAWLLLPYLAWVTYAATLNVGVWRLN